MTKEYILRNRYEIYKEKFPLSYDVLTSDLKSVVFEAMEDYAQHALASQSQESKLDLKQIERLIDDALDKETTESLTKWLNDKRAKEPQQKVELPTDKDIIEQANKYIADNYVADAGEKAEVQADFFEGAKWMRSLAQQKRMEGTADKIKALEELRTELERDIDAEHAMKKIDKLAGLKVAIARINIEIIHLTETSKTK